ncbi:MAG: carboxy terminal-processing peptidase [Ferruginibacter sp.]
MKKILLLALCCITKCALAQQPDALKQKAFVLKRFLEKNHYQPLVWNDSASMRLYDKWIGFLDDEKLFFTRADIALLEPYRTRLDDEMNGNGWQFFQLSSSLYKKRLLKTDSLIKKVLSAPLDFTAAETLQYPFSDFAANDNELQARWKKYCKWQVLRTIADAGDSANLSAAAFAAAEKKAVATQKIQEEKYIRRLLNGSPAEFDKDLQENYLNIIAWCYDPHTTYMNLSVKNEFETEMSASEYSTGFDVEENDKGEPEVSFLQPGGSAWRNGQLHKGDVLVAVKVGKDFKNISDLSEDEFEKAFAGTAIEETEIKVRTVTGDIKTVKLKKEKVDSEEEVVKSYVLQGSSNIGYISLPGFYSRENFSNGNDIKYDGAANDVSKEIVKLKKDSIAGLILDLRYNGGGSIWEAIQLAGIFIDIGPVALIKEKDGKTTILKDPNRGTIYDGPLLVLINGTSASASEFVSAVLQDYNRAIIAGGTSYGKGTAQTILPMDTLEANPNKKYEDFVKVTEEKFYRISGNTTQWKGVEPDISLPDLYASDDFKEKSEISALKPDMSKTALYKPLSPLPIAELKAKSAQRVSSNPFFNMVKKLNELAVQNNKGATIPLTWNLYLARYKSMTNMQQSLEEGAEKMAAAFPVRNNSFDMERIKRSGEYSQEVNETYLNNISDDPVIAEARAIMLDWTGKK